MTIAAQGRPLTIGRLSRILGIHPQRIRRLERRGQLPPPKRGTLSRDRYYLPDDVAELAKRLQDPATRDAA